MTDDLALSAIELFAGVGMLGEGLRAGLGYMGVATRAVCYVEREAYAAAVLAARMEEGSLDPAPVWSDVCTFDAAAWAGKVDCVVAGFPCQDISVAGRRAGLDGKRSGLFFEVLRIAADCGARWLFLENVAGIATATASAVDEAEGALEERAAARVLGELADRGWDAEWLTLSASDVGASHGRERWFCLAWRMADADNGDRPGPEVGSRAAHAEPVVGGADVDDPARNGGSGPHGQGGSGRGVRQAGAAVDDAECAEWRAGHFSRNGGGQGAQAGRQQGSSGLEGRRYRTGRHLGRSRVVGTCSHRRRTGRPRRAATGAARMPRATRTEGGG